MSWEEYGCVVNKNGIRYPKYEELEYNNKDFHGIIGSGEIKCCCRYQGLPIIYDGQEVVHYTDGRDEYEYRPFIYNYKGYRFYFESGYDRETPYLGVMIEPDGTVWDMTYDYDYGCGAEYIRSDDNWASVFRNAMGQLQKETYPEIIPWEKLRRMILTSAIQNNPEFFAGVENILLGEGE